MSRRSFLRALGDPAVDLAVYLTDVAAISGETALALGRSAGRIRPVVREVLWRQVYFTAVRAAPFTLLLALLVALAVAAQSPIAAEAGGEVLAAPRRARAGAGGEGPDRRGELAEIGLGALATPAEARERYAAAEKLAGDAPEVAGPLRLNLARLHERELHGAEARAR